MRDVLGELTWAARPDPPAPSVLCTTPPEQRHEFGALIAAYVASNAGWRAVNAGSDLPMDEVVRLSAREDALALSILFPRSEEGVRQDLEELRSDLPPTRRIYVGGRPVVLSAAESVEGVAGLASFTDFSGVLEKFRERPSG